MLHIGIIGYGYWGNHILRNFTAHQCVSVAALCDTNVRTLERVQQQYPDIALFTDAQEMIASPALDAIAIITPTSTHYELARQCLLNGKHIFIEKPFVTTSAQADTLINLAVQKNLMIMVDHTFLFSSSVQKIKELIDDEILGNLYYFDSIRVNMGPFRQDTNVIWDLAPHDFSIIDYLIEDKPVAISTNGTSLFNNGLEDIGYITLYFPNNLIAHLNLNWLSPVKVRTTFIGGDRKMLVWDDMNADEKIKIYDKSVVLGNRDGLYNLLLSARSGDTWSPKIDPHEALRVEVDHFVECILHDKTPVSDAYTGLRIVKLLEASSDSLKNGGKVVYL
jgi:predicted dehydrogenase